MPSTIQKLMTTDLATLDADAPVSDAARQMKQLDVGDVLLTDKSGKLEGILTDRDIVVRGIAAGKDLEKTKCSALCSHELVTVSKGDSSDHAVELMRKHAVRRLPVVDDGKPIGILSLGDLAKDRDPRSALAEISAASPSQ